MKQNWNIIRSEWDGMKRPHDEIKKEIGKKRKSHKEIKNALAELKPLLEEEKTALALQTKNRYVNATERLQIMFRKRVMHERNEDVE